MEELKDALFILQDRHDEEQITDAEFKEAVLERLRDADIPTIETLVKTILEN